MNFRTTLSAFAMLGLSTLCANAVDFSPANASATISLKTPGNPATDIPLTLEKTADGSNYQWVAKSGKLPMVIIQSVGEEKNVKPFNELQSTDAEGRVRRITLMLTATKDVYFNFGATVNTGYRHDDCMFYMPGFWYRRNLRSPKEAPSFHTSDSWLVREDRLSTPLTAIFNEKTGKTLSIARMAPRHGSDALTTHKEGEVILSGKTTVGYTGFINNNGTASLAFGFPYKEAPKTYIRKLTLAPEVEAYQLLKKGKTLILSWELREADDKNFSECVQHTWEYSFDTYRPRPVKTAYTPERMKKEMSNYFEQSYVKSNLVNYFASPEMVVATCENPQTAEIGFVGRTLLNAFNALEYAEQYNRTELAEKARSIFDSYLKNGFSKAGFFNEVMRWRTNDIQAEHSIRRQSEGVYAILYYLDYERRHGRKHPEWEKRIRTMLDMFLKLQNADGSFPRKFNDDFSINDKSGGSTPSATLPLTMGYKYFKDKRYLESARRSVEYLDKELISKADYFSSTLDANCEDKEASLYASTAAYYLALVSKGSDRDRYAALSRKAAFFALSWYYTWDVPFAEGQMLGDLNMKTRGWGNVSVENNHIDVYVFDFGDVLHWLGRHYGDARMTGFSDVINTSMRQLLPVEGNLCGIAKAGFYPEVVQHTNWDYGRNGKGFYNDIFAPGWTVASLWELLTPGRAEKFFGK